MKPTKPIEKQVVELSQKLQPITAAQMSWAVDSCLGNNAVRSRKTLYCLECGHSWKSEDSLLISTVTGCDCHACGKELKITNTQNESAYFAILTTKAGFQLVRMIWVQKSYYKGTPAFAWTSEVMQHWIDKSGKVTTLAKRVNGMSRYFDQWIFDSDLEVRTCGSYKAQSRYDIQPYKIYPGRSIIPELKRNGFSGHFYDRAPHKFFSLLLSVPAAETLLKSRQITMLSYLQLHPKDVENNWQSIKICIRNKYLIKDPSIWIDYIELLKHFGKDTSNAFYVCPADLRKAHDRLVEKKKRIERKKKLAELKSQMIEQQKEYEKQKSMFFGLCFQSDDIVIKPLATVEEFMIEGDELHHCVYERKYFTKKNSLILSARIDEKPIETIELSLSEMKIVQARGAGNKSTKYHKQILGLVNSNIHLVRNAMRKSVSV